MSETELEIELKHPIEKEQNRINEWVYGCPDCGSTQFMLICTEPTDDMDDDDLRVGDVYCNQCKECLDGIITEIDFDMDED